jgi:hypothetical protein
MPASKSRTFAPRTERVAETIIKLLGETSGAVIQPVSDDQNGWDCLVEFPPIASELPKDLAPPGLSILVQVKSSRNAASTCRLSLSNALKFARHPLPCFIVLVTYEAGVDKPKLFVRHIWGDLIRQILQRVRHAEAENKALNSTEITVRFTTKDQFDLRTLEHMAHTVDGLGSRYTAQKQKVIDEAGYETGYAVGKLVFAEGIDPETLVDLALGLVESVDVDQFSLTDMRFGIAAKKPLIEVTKGKVSLQPHPVGICTVNFRQASVAGDGLDLEGEIFAPGLPGLPPELWKLRVRTSLLDFTLKPDGVTRVVAELDTAVRLPFETIRNAAAIYSWGQKGPVDFTIWTDGKLLVSGQFDVDATNVSFWPALNEAIEPLAALAPLVRRPKELAFSITELVSHLKAIREFGAILGGSLLNLSFSMDEKLSETQITHYRGPFHLELGGHLFFAIVERPVLQTDFVEDTITLKLGQPTVLRSAIMTGVAEEHRDFIIAEMGRLPPPPTSHVMTMIPASSV